MARYNVIAFLALGMLLASATHAIPMHGAGKPGPTANENMLVVDNSLLPGASHLESAGGARKRPLSRLQLRSGIYFDFVVDEVVLHSRQPSKARRFASRWNGIVTRKISSGVPGGYDIYVIKLDTTKNPVPNISTLLAKDETYHNQQVRVSNQAAVKLIAIILHESQHNGLRIGFSMDLLLYSPNGEPAIFDLKGILSTQAQALGSLKF